MYRGTPLTVPLGLAVLVEATTAAGRRRADAIPVATRQPLWPVHGPEPLARTSGQTPAHNPFFVSNKTKKNCREISACGHVLQRPCSPFVWLLVSLPTRSFPLVTHTCQHPLLPFLPAPTQHQHLTFLAKFFFFLHTFFLHCHARDRSPLPTQSLFLRHRRRTSTVCRSLVPLSI